MFSTANVSGLGKVLVDSRGWTVYVLTKDGTHNVPCTDGTGCTDLWPDLPLPDGKTAQAGAGVQASMLKAQHNQDGETYPTYNGWLMYEYAADGGPAQSNGEGIQSFGGTWYALSPSGKPVTSGASSSQSSSGGYNY
jgi:predicted lipoprotein with Yx(FWY)xxD motif